MDGRGRARRAARARADPAVLFDDRAVAHGARAREAPADLLQHADDDPDGLYVCREDGAVLADGFDASAIDRAAASLPADWAYASLNAHESICEQDRANEDWYVKRAPKDGSLFGSSRVAAGDCDAKSLDGEWHDGRILYLSAAASLLRPATAKRVLDWLDAQPIYHIDAALRTPDARTFAAYQFRTNLFAISHDVSESRVA